MSKKKTRKEAKIINEYDVYGVSMLDHMLMRHKNEPWYKKFAEKVTMYYHIYIRDRWYGFKLYIKNMWRFRKFLRKYYPWDYHSQVELFAFGLDQLATRIENGYEVEESRNKKVKAIRELIELITTDCEDKLHEKYFSDDDFNDDYHVTEYDNGDIGFKNISPEEKQTKQAEKRKQFEEELDQEKKRVYSRIFRLIQGQDKDEVNKLYEEGVNQLPEDKRDNWNERARVSDQVYDGTGIETWWE